MLCAPLRGEASPAALGAVRVANVPDRQAPLAPLSIVAFGWRATPERSVHPWPFRDERAAGVLGGRPGSSAHLPGAPPLCVDASATFPGGRSPVAGRMLASAPW